VTGGRGSAEAFFDAIAGRYERSYALPSEESRRRMTRVLAELPREPARVLDLGVGTGRELSALLDAGHQPVGLDVSRAMLNRCSLRARPVPLVQADFWAPLPFESDAFDAAIALHGSLAHPPDDRALRRLLQELARVVRAGGVFLAEAPSPAWLERLEGATSLGDRRVRRTGPESCVYEDLVTGRSIEATFWGESAWHAALAPDWEPRGVASDELEVFVVARRR
jgi:SAM-dependent methyltransferase